jgi:hypothetical protein
MRCLFTVSDCFTVIGRGVVLVPGLKPIGEERFKVGDEIRLRRPDAGDLIVPIAGIELPVPNPENEVLIRVGNLSKEDVPVGTEVWSVD